MKNRVYSLLFAMLPLAVSAQQSIDLSGDWSGKTDRGEKVFRLPGSNLTNNFGDELSVDTKWTGSLYDSSFYFNPRMEKYRRKGHMKFPFFLTPNKHFTGTITYTRKVDIPKDWKKRRVLLNLERAHIETRVFVNGKEAGHQMSLNTPHVYDLTSLVTFGKQNEIQIAVYNGIENVCVGQDSHSVTDQTQGNWNGIVGKIELQARGQNFIENVKVFPDIHQGEAKVVVRSKAKKFLFQINGSEVKASKQNDSTYILSISNPRLWSEFDPYLYNLTVASKDDKVETTFGMREITVKGPQILLNGKPIYVRGTVENCNFPLTGFPPTDVESWERIFRQCKNYGLNTMRFHSYCPPEAAFTAADKVGFYLQPEGPSWPNHGVKLRRKMYIDTYLMEETQRMVEAYGNHASFVMMSAGNEPAGDWVRWGNDWVDYWKKTDNRRIYCSFNVGGGWAWDSGSEYHAKAGARGLDWEKKAPQSVDDYYQQLLFPRNYKDKEPNNSPIIAHEQGQWCVFPDLKERSQYTGVYKAYNFDIFEDLLNENGMGSMAEKFLKSSGKLQTLCYKFETERNLRTKDYAGFLYLGLNDYSGQGTALVGPLNVFWREKGYVDALQWRQFCNEVVAMAEFPKFTFEAGEDVSASIDFYNASPEDIKEATIMYHFIQADDNGTKALSGRMIKDIPVGKTLKSFSIPLMTNVDKAQKLTLEIDVLAKGKSYSNSYDYWVYPTVKEDVVLPKDILITDTLSDEAIKTLKKGGKVLLTAAGKVRYGNDVKQQYLPVFWNTSWFKMRPPHTTGATIQQEHGLFKNFPTDDWSNLNWWELLNKAQVMNLAEFPKDYQSPIQPIDTWHVSRKLGMLVEAKVLKGKLLMTTMDITRNLDNRIVARQMRKAILDYMMSGDFNPSLVLEPQVITDLFEKTAPAVNMFTKDSPDELKPKLK